MVWLDFELENISHQPKSSNYMQICQNAFNFVICYSGWDLD